MYITNKKDDNTLNVRACGKILEFIRQMYKWNDKKLDIHLHPTLPIQICKIYWVLLSLHNGSH